MTTIPMGRSASGLERQFYLGMAVLIALIVAAGFGPSYAMSLPRGLPVWVHLHGAVMVSWIVLFAVQAWLVRRRSMALHRRLGWLSTALVVAMVPLGIATNLLAIKRGATPPFFTPAQMMASDLLDLALFAGFFLAAILLRGRSEWHKRLLLCATVLLSWPALGRIMGIAGLSLTTMIPAASGVLILLALAGPVHDVVTRRNVHPAYLWGVGLIITAQPLHLLLAASPPIQALARALTPA